MNKPKLFLASCVSLVTTAMVFAIRGDIATAMAGAFHLTNEQLGLIFSPAFWAFTIAIFIIGGARRCARHARTAHLSAVGYVVGVLLVILAPRPAGPVSSLFDSTGTTLVYAGFFIMGLSQGLVEGVINPLIATIYNDREDAPAEHAARLVAGRHDHRRAARLCDDDGPERELGAQAVDDHGAGRDLPLHGRLARPIRHRARGVECLDRQMWREAAKPLFILLFVCMWMTAASELGPDQWFPTVMGQLVPQLQGVLFLVYTAGLMFVLRFYFSGWAHHEPIRALLVCSALTGIGLYWLGGLEPGTSPFIAFAAATVFGVGKTYLWPTMLGVTAEQFPRGGALLISLMGGTGMLSVAVALPIMGAEIDRFGPGAALQIFAIPTAILVVIFGGLLLYFKARGGYRAVQLPAGGSGREKRFQHQFLYESCPSDAADP